MANRPASVRKLHNTNEVIDALCGDQPSPNKAFAKLISLDGKKRQDQHVSNYRRMNTFPPYTFLVLNEALEKISCSAPPHLWRIAEPKKEKKRAA